MSRQYAPEHLEPLKVRQKRRQAATMGFSGLLPIGTVVVVEKAMGFAFFPVGTIRPITHHVTVNSGEELRLFYRLSGCDENIPIDWVRQV